MISFFLVSIVRRDLREYLSDHSSSLARRDFHLILSRVRVSISSLSLMNEKKSEKRVMGWIFCTPWQHFSAKINFYLSSHHFTFSPWTKRSERRRDRAEMCELNMCKFPSRCRGWHLRNSSRFISHSKLLKSIFTCERIYNALIWILHEIFSILKFSWFLSDFSFHYSKSVSRIWVMKIFFSPIEK